MLALFLGVLGAQSAYAQLSVTPVTWNVIGLDSNNPNTGPDTFQVGARACNTGGATLNNLAGTFFWDSLNPYVNLSGPITNSVRSLAAGACVDLYYPVTVTRTSLAHNTARRYHITVVADNGSTASTPTPRELYVEKIISQGRNTVISVTGPTSVFVGQTYQYTINASTATQGYEQLEVFLNLSNVVFQVQSVSATYSAPAGGTNNKIYADACGWENNPVSPNYRSCIGPVNYAGGKAGGTVAVTYTVKILTTGTTSANTLILDFSGSSYHYNADYGTALNITALPFQPNVGLVKSVTPATNVLPGTELTYTIAFQNTGNAPAATLIISDPIPANTDFKLGSATYSAGTTGLAAPIVEYSNDPVDPPASWTYVPTGAAGTFDANVKHVRWRFSGQMPASTQGSVTFTVRVR
ncbi:MAG: hypothetical protein LC754_17955 [Acidobacteria bacterium]|nr:hypothetical protein [Acidobacteriota bacterium]